MSVYSYRETNIKLYKEEKAVYSDNINLANKYHLKQTFHRYHDGRHDNDRHALPNVH